MNRRYFSLIFLGLVCFACVLCSDTVIKRVKSTLSGRGILDEKYTIVIDAGHGGFDPGKIGINNSLEKNINLSIAIMVKELLELNDIKVVMTREDDNGLYSSSDRNKKNADLKKRVEIIDEINPSLVVSIHQNSYSDSKIKGAQVFYHKKSNEGKTLAETLQTQLVDSLDKTNHRIAKSNESYYMLKKTECPLVIVECGFLSNPTEAELLISEEYQQKVAWAIHLGIIQYINGVDE